MLQFIIFETHLQKEREFKQRNHSYGLMLLKRGAVGGATYLPLVIGPHSTRDSSSCPITYDFMGSVCENTQSEESISP